MAKAQHIPKPGHASGLAGVAYCGRWSHYATGDHDQIRRSATANPETFCRRCLAQMKRTA